MFEWSEELLMVRDAVRTFVDTEIRPHREELDHGDLPPYDLLRKLYKTFGMDQMAADSFDKRIAAEEGPAQEAKPEREGGGGGFTMLPIIELCKCSPGMVTAMGVSVGLTAAAIMSKGTIAQKKRWARDVLTMDKISAWAITEPGSGSDAFGSMASTARRDGDEYVLNGSKTFITNGPYADTIVFICKLDDATPRPTARSFSSCSTAVCPASSSRSRCARWDCTRRPRACCSSTTCERAKTVSSARAKRRSAAPRAGRLRRRRS